VNAAKWREQRRHEGAAGEKMERGDMQQRFDGGDRHQHEPEHGGQKRYGGASRLEQLIEQDGHDRVAGGVDELGCERQPPEALVGQDVGGGGGGVAANDGAPTHDHLGERRRQEDDEIGQPGGASLCLQRVHSFTPKTRRGLTRPRCAARRSCRSRTGRRS
jgi:hypothetical protein